MPKASLTDRYRTAAGPSAAKWKANAWRGSSGKPVLNRELWLELEGAAAQHQVRWIWVRGHGTEPDQNRADSLARQAADGWRAPEATQGSRSQWMQE